jgi:hypothetical protein
MGIRRCLETQNFEWVARANQLPDPFPDEVSSDSSQG